MKVKLFLSFTRSHFLQVHHQRGGWSDEETVAGTQRAVVIMWNMVLVSWVGVFPPCWRQWKRGNKANGELRMSHPLKI